MNYINDNNNNNYNIDYYNDCNNYNDFNNKNNNNNNKNNNNSNNNNLNNHKNNNNNLKIECSTHNKKFKYMCKKDECKNVLVCSECMCSTHNGHIISGFTNNNEKYTDLLNEIKDKQPKIQNQIEINKNQIRQLDNLFGKVTRQSKEDEEKIITIFSEVRDLLSKTESNYMGEFEEIKNKNQNNHDIIKNELHSNSFLLDQINNIYTNKENLEVKDFNNKEQIIKLLYFNYISNSILEKPKEKQQSSDFTPLDSSKIIKECEKISKSAKAILENDQYEIQEILNTIKLEDIDKLPNMFEVDNNQIPYYYEGYKDIPVSSSIAIDFNYCKNLSFYLPHTIRKIYIVGGRCDPFINEYTLKTHMIFKTIVDFHIYDAEIQAPLKPKYEDICFHFHKCIPKQSVSNNILKEIHIYNLLEPIGIEENLKVTNLHIHKEYNHIISDQNKVYFENLYLYDLKNPILSLNYEDNTKKNIFIDGYKHPLNSFSTRFIFYKKDYNGNFGKTSPQLIKNINMQNKKIN